LGTIDGELISMKEVCKVTELQELNEAAVIQTKNRRSPRSEFLRYHHDKVSSEDIEEQGSRTRRALKL
jgi:hypothetical protein